MFALFVSFLVKCSFEKDCHFTGIAVLMSTRLNHCARGDCSEK